LKTGAKGIESGWINNLFQNLPSGSQNAQVIEIRC